MTRAKRIGEGEKRLAAEREQRRPKWTRLTCPSCGQAVDLSIPGRAWCGRCHVEMSAETGTAGG